LTNSVSEKNSAEGSIENKYRFSIVTGAFLAMLAVGTVICSLGVFFKPISVEFGWARAEVSLAASISAIFSGLTSIVIGRLADRFSPRFLTFICGFVGACACFMLSQITSLWQLYLGYGILGGISMANVIPIAPLITRRFKKQSGFLMGIALCGGGLGAIAAAPAITQLIAVFDWRTAYFVVGIAVLILVIVSGLCLRDPVSGNPGYPLNHPVSETASIGRSIKFGAAVRYGVFWILAIIILCSTFAQAVISIHLIPHITDLSITPMIAAAVLSVFNGFSAGGNFLAGKVIDFLGSRSTLVIGSGLMLVSMIILIFADTIWFFFVFAVLFGIAFGMITTLRFTLVAEIFGLSAQGVITGAYMLICNLGGAASPFIAGYLFDISGGYKMGFLIVIGMCAIGLLLSFVLKRKSSLSFSRKGN
jgi:MFS family permease